MGRQKYEIKQGLREDEGKTIFFSLYGLTKEQLKVQPPALFIEIYTRQREGQRGILFCGRSGGGREEIQRDECWGIYVMLLGCGFEWRHIFNDIHDPKNPCVKGNDDI